MALRRSVPDSLLTDEEDFGAFIERIRRRCRIQIKEIVELFPAHLNEHTCGNRWNRYTYSHLVGERRRRIRLQELLPLYTCLVLAGVHFNAGERNRFLFLAWRMIEEPANNDPFPTDGPWALLLQEVATFDGLPLSPEPKPLLHVSTNNLIAPFPVDLQEDQRHLVGRETWIHEIQSHVRTNPPRKLVVIPAALGAGKSSALQLLRRKLEEQGSYQVFFFTCSTATNMTAEERLDRFLADAFVFFHLDASQQGHLSLQERTEMLLKYAAQVNHQVILFIDNGEVILQTDGQLTACWHQFFRAVVHYQHAATFFFASREWPGWTERNRSYFTLQKLPALSPQAGAAIWRRMGFDDVDEELLQQVSIRCGGNPWLIELRASTLADLPFDEEDGMLQAPENAQENMHTRLIRQLLQKPRLFGPEADRETQHMLQEVIRGHLSPHAHLLLDVLACSPLALPLHPLKAFIPQVEEAFEELQHASLVDLDTKIYAHRAQLLPVVSEAAVACRLTEPSRRESIEEMVADIYAQWLKDGIESDQEKSSVVTELILFSLGRKRLLEAAEQLLPYSWLLARFGHATRIARVVYHFMESEPWRSTLGQECGGFLLRHHLAPYLGQKSSYQDLEYAYQHIYSALLSGEVSLCLSTELHVVHQLMRLHRDSLHFQEAEQLIDHTLERHPDMQRIHPTRFASLRGRQAALLGAWSDYASDEQQHEQARLLRDQAIALHRQCIGLWETLEEQKPAAKRSGDRYRRARLLNDLGYYLRKQGHVEQALAAIEESLHLKTAGYVEPGSLATSYSEKAQCLAALGKFQLAVHFDQLAVEDIQQAAASGNSLLQEEVWIYLVERGNLFLRLGKLQEAESLFQKASNNISKDRRSYRVLAQAGLTEIRQWRQTSPEEKLDWRWSSRYRDIVRYDPFELMTPGAFTRSEQDEWDFLQEQEPNEENQKRMGELLSRSRDREVLDAEREGRDPQFRYPRIRKNQITKTIEELARLTADIDSADAAIREPNAHVRTFYLGVAQEHTSYLKMIQATHDGDTTAFLRYNEEVYGKPLAEEVEQALTYIGRLIALGRQRADTVEVSDQVTTFLRSIGAPLRIPAHAVPLVVRGQRAMPPAETIKFSALTLKHFLDATLPEYGFDGWRTRIDATATIERIEQLTQELILPEKARTLPAVRRLLKEELEDHMQRAVQGAASRLDLLATGTRNFMATEEGLAQYGDRELARLVGKPVEEFTAGSLFGTISTGLAAGVLTEALTFSRLSRFLVLLLILYRTVMGIDKTVEQAQSRAPSLARQRCLRTFRGVPDLSVPGVALFKDWLYHYGYRCVLSAIEQDPRIHQRLMVGVVGLADLEALAELDITEPSLPVRRLSQDPELEKRLLAFQLS
ncbi:hypothetical protein KSF_108640 [Reticulibacter mediterranei]|uniref:Tetratricopeptide repeat protein n=1 Tax=Reticulibacter mediterranei TaxID=2778369 RepID=A0A8J3J3D3_9CHLR|nr:tetratricopeptide repeat protein [Reticulibacter mediterranei]GHP00817.1 hypothetical protein KSF_108640 [Reticulibacter mediterranei]